MVLDATGCQCDGDGSGDGVSSHDDLTDVDPGDHHAKTTEAAELTDVSADSDADAHHTKTTEAAELTDVSADSDADAHHSRPSAGQGLTETSGSFGFDVVLSGTASLSGGSAVVPTGMSDSSATFMVAVGVVDPGADAAVTAEAYWNDSASRHEIHFHEGSTNIGAFDASYDVIRVS